MTPDRGQTMPDFVVAVGIFLLVVGFVVAFVPELAVPYQDQEQPLVAERAADGLADTWLAGDDPATLETDCVLPFFNRTASPDCDGDTTAPLTEQLGIADTYSVNVTLDRSRANSSEFDALCGDGGTIGACGDERLSVGPSVPERNRQVATAHRTVHVDGRDAVLRVRVW